jgi:hypothetical protein
MRVRRRRRGSQRSIARAALALFALGLAARGASAELVVRDLDVELILPPTSYRWQLSTPGGSASGHDGFSSATELAVGARWSLARPGDSVGLVAGAAIAGEGAAASGTELADYSGRLQAGMGWAPADAWLVTATGGCWIGEGSFRTDATPGAPGVNLKGYHHGFDARLDCAWRASRSVAVEALGGFWWDRHRLTGGGNSLLLTRSGPFLGIGLVWRLSSAPEHLE